VFGRKGVKRVESIETDDVHAIESEGFSLEELGSAYALAIEQAAADGGKRSEPLAQPTPAPAPELEVDGELDEMLEPPDATETDGVPVTPESILEAVLFLGTSNNRPVPIEKLLELLRGMSASELEEVVDTLNAQYEKNDRAMTIVKSSGGFHMQLVPELYLVRDRFYGKIKETQLTQSAIDCLSLVAYQPGITREDLEQQWNQPAANMLSTLVRKGLLRVENVPAQSGHVESRYHTTDRFLEIIGLESLADLPLSEDI
jgi:segregation and condensation protein B